MLLEMLKTWVKAIRFPNRTAILSTASQDWVMRQEKKKEGHYVVRE